MTRREGTARWWAAALAALAVALATVARPTGQTATYPGDEWPAPGGDWASTRYSTLARIDRTNVSRLSGAWSVELPAGQVSKAPLMVKDGRLFAVTSQGTILALDPATGATLWTYRPDTPFSGNRGIGIGNGLLFAGQRDSSVIAVSQETGRLAWKFERPADLPPQGMSSAPAFGNGVVVAVVSSGDNFMRGRALGIDATTGKGLWTFEVIPGPGQPGHETWPQDSDIWKYGGGAIWTTPSVDAALGLVYLETGNAVPQWGGEVRPGDNLYNNSVVALDLKTGKIRWHFQLVHHDIWEHDVGTPLVLYDATIGGRQRQVLLAMRTDGVPFVLDRATGQPVLPVEERAVKQDAFLKTAPTQPFTVGADRLGPECADQAMLPPGFIGGCYFDPVRAEVPNLFLPHMNMRQTPMAYSPQTGYLYASVCVNPAWVRRAESPWVFVIADPRARAAAVRPDGGRRQPHDEDVWQKRVDYAGLRGRRRRDRHRRRAGVPRRARWRVPGLRREDRRRAVAVPDRPDRPARRRRTWRWLGDQLPGRERAVRRVDHEPPHLVVQARRRARSGAGAQPPAAGPAVERTGGRQPGRAARHRDGLQHPERRPPRGMAERLRREPEPYARRPGSGGDVHQHHDDDAHHRGARRLVDVRPDRAWRERFGDGDEAGRVRVPVPGAPVVDGGADGERVWNGGAP